MFDKGELGEITKGKMECCGNFFGDIYTELKWQGGGKDFYKNQVATSER